MSQYKKPETTPEMHPWDQEALSYMKATAKDPNQLGFQLKFDDAARAWYAYFREKGLTNKARFLRHQMRSGGTYVVPTQWPDQYDPSLRPSRPAPRPAPKAEKPTLDKDRLRWWDK